MPPIETDNTSSDLVQILTIEVVKKLRPKFFYSKTHFDPKHI